MGSRGPMPKASAPVLQFRLGVPPPPDWLDEGAKAEYQRAAAELDAAGTALQQVDFAVLCAYAQAYSDLARLTKEIRDKGEVVEGYNGPIANPLIRTLALAFQTLRATAQKLGFSPSDRGRIGGKAPGSGKNPLNEFI